MEPRARESNLGSGVHQCTLLCLQALEAILDCPSAEIRALDDDYEYQFNTQVDGRGDGDLLAGRGDS